MFKGLLLFTVLLISTVVHAQLINVTLMWERPTKKVNGDPLPIEELKGYHIKYNVGGGAAFYDLHEGLIPPTATEYSFSQEEGDYCYIIAAVNTDNVYSNYTVPVCDSAGDSGTTLPTPTPPISEPVPLPPAKIDLYRR